jgi:hypothetical protein
MSKVTKLTELCKEQNRLFTQDSKELKSGRSSNNQKRRREEKEKVK